MKTTPGFAHFVSIRNEPATIPEHQIKAVKQLINSNYPWQAKTKTLRKGTQIEIIEGPLQGCTGVLIADATQNNVAIEIPALCESMVFTLKHHQFKPIQTH